MRVLLETQERESSDSPMLNAFWRVAPSDRRNFLAILPAGVFLRAIVFSSRTSPAVHARRFFARLAINPPFQERQLVSLTGADEKSGDRTGIIISAAASQSKACRTRGETRAIVRYFLARCGFGSKSNLHGRLSDRVCNRRCGLRLIATLQRSNKPDLQRSRRTPPLTIAKDSSVILKIRSRKVLS